MAKQLFYEDVKVGDELPSVVKQTSLRYMVEWAMVNGDSDPIHWDKESAVKASLPSAIVNGRYKICLLLQMLCNWMGDDGMLKVIDCQHRGMDIVGDPIAAKGKVARKFIEGENHCIECEIWTENPKGQRTAPGTAIVVLTAKG